MSQKTVQFRTMQNIFGHCRFLQCLSAMSQTLMFLTTYFEKNIVYLHIRYFKLAIMTNQSCYCRYIMSIIIQHLSAWIEQDILWQPVHQAMHKENSWIFTKSTKDIKIINKTLLPYYYHIFWI